MFFQKMKKINIDIGYIRQYVKNADLKKLIHMEESKIKLQKNVLMYMNIKLKIVYIAVKKYQLAT